LDSRFRGNDRFFEVPVGTGSHFFAGNFFMRRYAVIGHPVSHSLSPRIHALFALQTGRDITYEAILAPKDDFAGVVRRFQCEGAKGANVTVPFKEAAFQLATTVSDRAKKAEAANTLVFGEDGAIHADNTDGVGLVRDLTQNRRFDLSGRKGLLIGAGGAARGVLQPLMEAGLSELVIVNRTIEKAKALLKQHDGNGDTRVRASDFGNLCGAGFDVVINATSAGLMDQAPDLPEGILGPDSIAYDMMYGRPSPFLQRASALGAADTADGLGMLVEQAAESFRIWEGVLPDTAPVLHALRSPV
jgi:shikimate dehydrogenase